MRYRDRIWSPAVLLLTSVNLRISSIRSRLDIFSTYSTHINYAIVPPYTTEPTPRTIILQGHLRLADSGETVR